MSNRLPVQVLALPLIALLQGCIGPVYYTAVGLANTKQPEAYRWTENITLSDGAALVLRRYHKAEDVSIEFTLANRHVSWSGCAKPVALDRSGGTVYMATHQTFGDARCVNADGYWRLAPEGWVKISADDIPRPLEANLVADFVGADKMGTVPVGHALARGTMPCHFKALPWTSAGCPRLAWTEEVVLSDGTAVTIRRGSWMRDRVENFDIEWSSGTRLARWEVRGAKPIALDRLQGHFYIAARCAVAACREALGLAAGEPAVWRLGAAGAWEPILASALPQPLLANLSVQYMRESPAQVVRAGQPGYATAEMQCSGNKAVRWESRGCPPKRWIEVVQLSGGGSMSIERILRQEHANSGQVSTLRFDLGSRPVKWEGCGFLVSLDRLEGTFYLGALPDLRPPCMPPPHQPGPVWTWRLAAGGWEPVSLKDLPSPLHANLANQLRMPENPGTVSAWEAPYSRTTMRCEDKQLPWVSTGCPEWNQPQSPRLRTLGS
jgi:hypothetical protein